MIHSTVNSNTNRRNHMKTNLIKAGIFIVTFIIAASIISAVINKGNTDMTVEMSQASLPVVSMRVNDTKVNILHGYTMETMKANYLRDTLTPLPDDRRLYVDIDLMGAKLSGIYYEIRSLDTERLVEKTEVYDYVTDEDIVTAKLGIKDLIEKNKEYILMVAVNLADGQQVHYYTRILQNEGLHDREMLDFVQNFHDRLFDKSEAKSLVTYLESNAEGDNSSYQHVNIHSSFSQVTWGDLEILGESDRNIQIIEMDENMGSVKYEFNVNVKNNDKTENYMVKEFYRMRYTEERMYLLDYEREMEQIFNPENDVFVNDKILLGVAGDNVMLSETGDGSTIVFKQQDALYEYKNSEGLLSRIFSFYDNENFDIRTLYDRHEIKLLDMDETGNVYFMVYGYMNRGRHEGNVGISVYYYDHSKNSVEEKIYIPYDKSVGMLNKNMEKLSYINRNQKVYVYIDGNIYSVNLSSSEGKLVASNLSTENVVASENNRMVAYTLDNVIHMLDLNTGSEKSIRADNGQIITVLGFLGEDLVYGLANQENMIRDLSGMVIRPMHTIRIENKNGNILKEYAEDNIYVTDATVGKSAIQMKRVRYDTATGKYYSTSDDQIMDNHTDVETKNSLISVTTEDRETIKEIALLNNVTKSIHVQVPKEVLIEGGRSFIPEDHEQKDYYYVYARGGLTGVYSKVNEAVNIASENNGVVVNDVQNYIWQKGNRKVRTELSGINIMNQEDSTENSLARCLDAMLIYAGTPSETARLLENGSTALSILENNIEGDVLYLSGCSLSDVLYYVSNGMPVLAKVDGGRSVLIIGYDEKNTIILDPLSDRKYKKGMNDSREWFSESDNEFITYVLSE